MKNKVLTFIIGTLIGAIITTIAFYIYIKTFNTQNVNMPNGEIPQMMDQNNNQVPSEKPSGEQGMPSGIPSNNMNIQ